jgi:hypothetical protein
MGVDFDIIDEKGLLIDRYPLKWLIRDWNSSFSLDYLGHSIKYIIKYCDDEIIILDEKINKLQKILDVWNENDFEKRKKLKINLISYIDNEKEFYSVIEYFAEYDIDKYEGFVKLSDGSKLIADFDYYSTYKSYFTNFKNFLSKYINNKYDISY